MIICIGSQNKAKIIAVSKGFSNFPDLWMTSFKTTGLQFVLLPQSNNDQNKTTIDPLSNVSKMPMSLEETIKGAKNRAIKSYNYLTINYQKNIFGVGLESGLLQTNHVRTNYLNVSACSIFDGQTHALGFSPMFEYPQNVIDRILKGEESGAMQDIFGHTGKGRGGVISVLSNGILTRDNYDEMAVIMAITSFMNLKKQNI